ncbi:hypothetical protein Csp2054_04055 [Curtobacterium sp. 'Ferrero']|uniref:helix-turn-helix domain-containing protein n=1 Tax=Curtobacterium sp. 'Ferrero' TaxID=2033654 RepID=UPI000BD9E6D8|nr:helix-turn-helix domain-containing protein [Curtobacterium sp. 'Ferrero']PCN48764.1 hypothetical protein Csp2054_04055 [Curtobacterium sp. 'Ferrero']
MSDRTDAAPAADCVGRPRAAARREAAGDDLAQATSFYERMHNAHRVVLTPTDAAFSYRVRSVGDEHMTIRSSALSADRWGRIEPEGHFLLTWAQDGAAAIDAGTDEEQLLLPGTAAMYPTGRALTIEASAGTVLHAVDFRAAFLEDLDAERRAAAPRRLRFTRKPDPTKLLALRRRLATAAPELLRPDTDPGRRAMLTRAVAQLVLDAFVDPGDDAGLGPSDAVGRALQYIDDHAAEPMTTADIAAAARMSSRGLQQAFVRADLPSPMTALRETRLRLVRDALRHADPATTTVGAVAVAWGFGHLGRFAGYYEQAFGELPSVTLRERG